jgi:hypothetical protein
MRTDHYSLGPLPPPAEPCLRVTHDFPADMPVTEAELDVIEAFLGAQLRAILSDGPADGAKEQADPNTDLNLCHNHAKLKRCRKSRE